MLETSIIKTGKMDVMERNQMTNTILDEQLLGQEGITESGGQLGGLTGLDYVIYGTITKFGSKQSGFKINTSQGLGRKLGRKTGGLMGSGLKTSKITAVMGVNVKVTDVSTGAIIIADEVDAEAESGKSFSVGGIETGKTAGDPFAIVQHIVAKKMAEKIVTHHIPIKVIKVQDDGTLIVNYGDVFLSIGERLAAFEVGESFVDPDTGGILGVVEVVRVDARFSRARVVGKPFAVSAGLTLKRPTEEAQKPQKRKRSGSRIR